ncbi:hypothetical protein H7U19_16365 [Hyunsoonleella sp. SJ7]|uniref:Uncharacterized protein n=1 Tax=Hyunsoonleella aquatilis TaxID=2762758 RepID=A0A923HGQ5_9FLAO|nr:hypothetical protein [Hyunsoonleella aquatilis]MBC3759988.1 hypothetical protein [Hyunsoonleella aquatilis]
MKEIIKLFVIAVLFLGTNSITAQSEISADQPEFYVKILKEMPSLDAFGEHKYTVLKSEASTFRESAGDNQKNLTDYYKNIMREMPSLDAFGEYKYYTSNGDAVASSASPKSKAITEDFDQKIVEEMPSLRR